MILIDIFVPVINRTYDFLLDADKPVKRIMLEINSQIAEAEATELYGEDEFWLCDIGKGIILNRECSLAEQGIAEGTKLLLI